MQHSGKNWPNKEYIKSTYKTRDHIENLKNDQKSAKLDEWEKKEPSKSFNRWFMHKPQVMSKTGIVIEVDVFWRLKIKEIIPTGMVFECGLFGLKNDCTQINTPHTNEKCSYAMQIFGSQKFIELSFKSFNFRHHMHILALKCTFEKVLSVHCIAHSSSVCAPSRFFTWYIHGNMCIWMCLHLCI